VALSLAAIAFALWHFWLRPSRVFDTSAFDAAAWDAPYTVGRLCYRGGMAIDVKKNVLRAEMSRTEVEARLGSPDKRWEHEYWYVLGMCSGFRMDLDVLHVYFGDHGQYKSAAIRQH
jgi:hypothetical protein